MSYKKASGPMERLQEAVRIVRDQVDDLEEKGYSGTPLKRSRAIHARLWTAYAQLEDILAEEEREKQRISQEVLEWRRYAERLKAFASLKMDEASLDLFPRIWSLEKIEEIKRNPPFNGEKCTNRNHILNTLRKMEDEGLPREKAERIRDYIEKNVSDQ